ncbi:hypothetical protein [Mesorhizobium sp. BH1-1-4]|nr:hypothetical protein [Mesorhizobium sp. BH1-1-4]
MARVLDSATVGGLDALEKYIQPLAIGNQPVGDRFGADAVHF